MVGSDSYGPNPKINITNQIAPPTIPNIKMNAKNPDFLGGCGRRGVAIEGNEFEERIRAWLLVVFVGCPLAILINQHFNGAVFALFFQPAIQSLAFQSQPGI